MASRAREDLSMPEGISVGELAEEILRLHPAMKKLGNSIRFSVNLDISGSDTPLHDGDEVGVLPPVAGG